MLDKFADNKIITDAVVTVCKDSKSCLIDLWGAEI